MTVRSGVKMTSRAAIVRPVRLLLALVAALALVSACGSSAPTPKVAAKAAPKATPTAPATVGRGAADDAHHAGRDRLHPEIHQRRDRRLPLHPGRPARHGRTRSSCRASSSPDRESPSPRCTTRSSSWFRPASRKRLKRQTTGARAGPASASPRWSGPGSSSSCRCRGSAPGRRGKAKTSCRRRRERRCPRAA